MPSKKYKVSSDVQPPLPIILETVDNSAVEAAAKRLFAEYRAKLAPQTVRRIDADMRLFANYLHEAHDLEPVNLSSHPLAWSLITGDQVNGFAQWQLEQGYTQSTSNIRLSTVRSFAKLASQSGLLSQKELSQIRKVNITKRKAQRTESKLPSSYRRGTKKAAPIKLTMDQVQMLMRQPLETAQGSRDGLLLSLLLEHGLRVNELASLKIGDIDRSDSTFHISRNVPSEDQTFPLSEAALRAYDAYHKYIKKEAAGTQLLRAVRKGGKHVSKAGLTTRGISLRVEKLGAEIGIQSLSAHDLRHTWAANAAQSGVEPAKLQVFGGWSSRAMVRKFFPKTRHKKD